MILQQSILRLKGDFMNKRILLCLFMCLCLTAGCHKSSDIGIYPFGSLDELVHSTYSAKEFRDFDSRIQDAASNNLPKLTLHDVKQTFHVECIRKNYRNYYYAVFKLNGGGYAFIYMNPDFEVNHVLVFEKMLSKSDFDSIKPYESTLNEVIDLDPNYIPYPISIKMTTGHIVKEGAILVICEGELVTDIQFTSNQEIQTINSLESNLIYGVPYLLPQDKQF